MIILNAAVNANFSYVLLRNILLNTFSIIVYPFKNVILKRVVLLYNNWGWIVYYNENILALLIQGLVK